MKINEYLRISLKLMKMSKKLAQWATARVQSFRQPAALLCEKLRREDGLER